jgi:hypothetical protein
MIVHTYNPSCLETGGSATRSQPRQSSQDPNLEGKIQGLCAVAHIYNSSFSRSGDQEDPSL